jgi:hypothetical protein
VGSRPGADRSEAWATVDAATGAVAARAADARKLRRLSAVAAGSSGDLFVSVTAASTFARHGLTRGPGGH